MFRSFLLGLFTISAMTHAGTPATSAVYEITVQNDSGVETAKRVLPSDGQRHTWPMSGAIVEITTPPENSGVTELRLYADSTKQTLLHTARISGDALPVHVAYALCGGHVTYMSPAPTIKCPCGVKPSGS